MFLYSFNEFEQKHSQVIDLCQCIEYELKYINHYLLMVDGYSTNFLMDLTMRELVNLLRDSLDDSKFVDKYDLYYDGQTIISLLIPVIRDRNFWAHNSFTDLRFAKNDKETVESSNVYDGVCQRLKKSLVDFQRISNLCQKYRLKIENSIKKIGYTLLSKTYYTQQNEVK